MRHQQRVSCFSRRALFLRLAPGELNECGIMLQPGFHSHLQGIHPVPLLVEVVHEIPVYRKGAGRASSGCLLTRVKLQQGGGSKRAPTSRGHLQKRGAAVGRPKVHINLTEHATRGRVYVHDFVSLAPGVASDDAVFESPVEPSYCAAGCGSSRNCTRASTPPHGFVLLFTSSWTAPGRFFLQHLLMNFGFLIRSCTVQSRVPVLQEHRGLSSSGSPNNTMTGRSYGRHSLKLLRVLDC